MTNKTKKKCFYSGDIYARGLTQYDVLQGTVSSYQNGLAYIYAKFSGSIVDGYANVSLPIGTQVYVSIIDVYESEEDRAKHSGESRKERFRRIRNFHNKYLFRLESVLDRDELASSTYIFDISIA